MVLLENRAVDGSPALPWDAAALRLGRRDRRQRGQRPHPGRRQRDRAAGVHGLAARGPARGAARRRGHLLGRRGVADRARRPAARPADQPRHRRRRVRGCGSSTRTARSSSPRTASRRRRWSGSAGPPRSASRTSVELTTRYTPTESSHCPDRLRRWSAAAGSGSTASWSSTRSSTAVGDDLGAAFLTPPSATTPITLTAGTPVDLRFEIDLGAHEDFLAGALSFQFGTEPDAEDHDALIAEAAAAAADGRRRARGGRHQLDGRVRGLRPRARWPCPAGRTTWWRPSRPRTRARSCSSTRARPC